MEARIKKITYLFLDLFCTIEQAAQLLGPTAVITSLFLYLVVDWHKLILCVNNDLGRHFVFKHDRPMS